MPIYNVEIEGVLVVESESENEKEVISAAQRLLYRAGGVAEELSAVHAKEIKSVSDLEDQWEGDALPYNGVGDKRIFEYLE